MARACQEAGLIFVGPPPENLDALGDKVSARALAAKADISIVPGLDEPVQAIGFPLIIKAAFGGGSRGMRVVESAEKLPACWTKPRGKPVSPSPTIPCS
jgi:biotin carboxylase